jgi:hypothetical protein
VIDIKKGTWFDHEANVGGGVFDLIQRRGHEQPAAWLRREGLMASQPHVVSRTEPRIVKTYPYCDESGEPLFEVVRLEPKDFRQRRPDGHGSWIWNLRDTRRVPYLLPELLKAIAAGETIYIPEGEKDVDNLRAIGLAATTSPGGIKKWRHEYSEFLRGADVVVLPDNHSEGREHGNQVIASLRGIAKSIRLFDIGKQWAECPDKGDISDWLASGGTAEKLETITQALPEMSAPAHNTSSGPEWGKPKDIPTKLAKVADFSLDRRHLRPVAVPARLRCGCRTHRARIADRTTCRYQASAENGLDGGPECMGRLYRQARNAEISGNDGGTKAASSPRGRGREGARCCIG